MKKLGIIAGGGELPTRLVAACEAAGRAYFVLGLEGFCDSTLAHQQVRLGAVGEALKILKKEQVEEVIMAGRVGRPTLASLRPDMKATMLIAKLGKEFFSGDDALLSAIVGIMEGEGFKVVGVADVCAHLIAQDKIYTKRKPSKDQFADIAHGMKVARALGDLDVGQAVFVENGYVLAVEAAEGTAAMIARVADLSQHEKGSGVLVKCKKPTQDMRADLPTIGLETMEQIHAAGLAGIAVEAGGSIILQMQEALAYADKHGLFVVGIPSPIGGGLGWGLACTNENNNAQQRKNAPLPTSPLMGEEL